MSDLISRAALIAAINSGTGEIGDVLVQIETAPAARVSLVANMTGGVLQGASSDYDNVDIYVLDFDDTDPSPNVIEIDGSEAYLMQEGADFDPEFVRQVIEADA